MKKQQLELFTAPEKPRVIRLGPNQQAVFARVLRYGDVRVREAGRIVYLRRGWRDPSRVGSDWLDRAGLRVLLSLRRVGLIRYDRGSRRWVLTAKGRASSDLIGPERSEGPLLAPSEHRAHVNRARTLRSRLGHACKSRRNSCSSPSISMATANAGGSIGGRW